MDAVACGSLEFGVWICTFECVQAIAGTGCGVRILLCGLARPCLSIHVHLFARKRFVNDTISKYKIPSMLNEKSE